MTQQRREKQSARFTVQGPDSYILYKKAQGIAAVFFGEGEEYDLYFDDAEPFLITDSSISEWKCEVTAVAKHRIPE